MSKIKTLFKLLKGDKKELNKAIFSNFSKMYLARILTDKTYIKKQYKAFLGKKLNLKNPQTFNEKLQWLKLYNRKLEYSILVDKQEVKKHISKAIGEEYVIPTLGVWSKFSEIDFNKLPNQFVLKCTHDSGSVVICRDKNSFNMENANKKLSRALRRNMFWHGREWPYKNVKPRIIAEEYINDGDNVCLPVYKFMCFDGEPKIIQSIQNDKQVNESVDYFDTKWNILDIRQGFPNSEKPLAKPENLNKMLKIARELSKGHSFIRIDLYMVGDKIYFSEYTFYSDCGLIPFEPSEWDLKLGSWINLPNKE